MMIVPLNPPPLESLFYALVSLWILEALCFPPEACVSDSLMIEVLGENPILPTPRVHMEFGKWQVLSLSAAGAGNR